MGRYGRNMRDCCDSVADPKVGHINGCSNFSDQPTAGVALKPCPFCGSSEIHYHHNDARCFFWYECVKCDVETRGADNPDDALTQWNTRTPASGAVEAAPGGWLIRENDGGWFWTGTRLAAVAALTGGREVVSLAALTSEPQLSGKTGELKSEPKAEGEASFLGHVVETHGDPIFVPKGQPIPLPPGRGSVTPVFSGPQNVTAPQPLQGGEVTREVVARLTAWAEALEADPGRAAHFGCVSAEGLRPVYWNGDMAKDLRAVLALISPAQREGEG